MPRTSVLGHSVIFHSQSRRRLNHRLRRFLACAGRGGHHWLAFISEFSTPLQSEGELSRPASSTVFGSTSGEPWLTAEIGLNWAGDSNFLAQRN